MTDQLPAPARPPAGVLPGRVLRLLQADKTDQAISALIGDRDKAELLFKEQPDVWRALQQLSGAVVALREQSVVAIQNDEAFVQRTKDHTLQRVRQRVRLSIPNGELFQIPKRVKGADGNWTATVSTPGYAQLTVPGLRAMNRVAGCSVGLAPTVIVDGETRSNPYIERGPDIGGAVGTVRRIVVAVIVAGLTEVGTPVVVRAVTEFEPVNELRHALFTMLSRQFDYHGKPKTSTPDIVLVDGEDYPAWKASQAYGRWKAVPAHTGMVLACNLDAPDVLDAMQSMMQVISTSITKAQTVAERNAMRRHPALSRGAVAIDQATGVGHVEVTGWTAKEETLTAFTDAMSRLGAGGGNIDLDMLVEAAERDGKPVEIIDVQETHDPEAESDPEIVDHRVPDEEEDDAAATRAALMERNGLIADIDALIEELQPTPMEVQALGYTPGESSVEDLRRIRDALTARRKPQRRSKS